MPTAPDDAGGSDGRESHILAGVSEGPEVANQHRYAHHQSQAGAVPRQHGAFAG